MTKLVLLSSLLVAWPAAASADWLVVPWIGTSVWARTGYFDPDDATKQRKLAVGATLVRQLSKRFAVDGELLFTPGILNGDVHFPVIQRSRLLGTAVHLRIFLPELGRIRPFASAGIGIVRVSATDIAQVFPVRQWQGAVDIGAGALVDVSRRLSVMVETRYLRSERSAGAATSIGFGDTFIDFWRISTGLGFRF